MTHSVVFNLFSFVTEDDWWKCGWNSYSVAPGSHALNLWSVKSEWGSELPVPPPLRCISPSIKRELSPLQDDKVRCNGGRRVSWLKFSQNKTLFVWLLFARLPMRQKSIPHDAFIVFSQTRTRPHSSYCTVALTTKNTHWKSGGSRTTRGFPGQWGTS